MCCVSLLDMGKEMIQASWPDMLKIARQASTILVIPPDVFNTSKRATVRVTRLHLHCFGLKS